MPAVRRHRRRRLLAHHLDDLHHPEVFVVEDVALHDELPDVVGIAREDVRVWLAGTRYWSHFCG